MNKSSSTENFVVENCILSYPHLFQPQQVNDQGDPKYSAVLLVNEQGQSLIMQKAQALAASHFIKGETNLPSFAWPVVPAAHKMSNDGSFPYRDNPRTANLFVLNAKASADYPPQVVDQNRQPVIDRGQIYAGCVVAAGIRLYTYNNMGNIGVGVGLAAIMKQADGESLGGGTVSADTLFASVQAQPATGQPSPNGAPAPQGTVSHAPADPGMPAPPSFLC